MTEITTTKSGKCLDNRYVVPYNRYLIVKYQAHINILFKYITKGPDRSKVVAEPTSNDEIAQYLDCRSISCYEAIWRLFEYQIHERNPSVVRLCIHMPHSQSISFQPSQTVRSIIGRPGITNTMLTQWFVLNQRDSSARKYTYDQIPNAYVWSTQLDDWSPRKQGFAIGRIPSVPAASGDIFYLRMLLGKISGAFNFKDLRTLHGVVYENYQHTCQAMGLLSTDDEWDLVMAEIKPMTPNTQQHNLNTTTHYQYDCQIEESRSQEHYTSLNDDQVQAYSSVMDAIKNNKGQLFFLHGHGGTGKTFLYNCIISRVRSTGGITLVVASSGIAATLLPDGVTAHSRFKIPLEIDNLSTCMVKKGSEVAELLKSATLIVWDEAPMIHRLAFEAVDRTMCDIMNMPLSGENYLPFGGKVVLLGGDFRQFLPVVPNGSRADNINASLPRSYLWTFCTLLHLKINMRITNHAINTTPMFDGLTFPNWVLAVGNGTLNTQSNSKSTTSNDLITIPAQFLIPPTNKPIESYQSLEYIKSRAIVSPTNVVVSEINDLLLAQIPTPAKIYFCADSLSPTKTNITALETEYPVEFLNSLSFNGIPEHKLELKPFTVVMLLRNINPSAGMCNGTRVLLTNLGQYIISGLIVNGTLEGTTVAIPRIILDITDNRWPFTLRRRQFPIRVCYAMTINKSQGQTLDHVGIYLPKPVFSHGQLYVAVSRVRSADGLHILISNDQQNLPNQTKNIVYQDVLNEILEVNIDNR
ncbi:ATP-dependent DNA helicase PIF1 [Linum perenne]